MAAKAIPYDQMAEEAPEASDAGENEATEDPSEDDEFMMHAEDAGFSGDKAAALWRAIARCVELLPNGGGVSMGDLGDEEA